MPHLITFSSSKFDLSQETPNTINPLGGESLLEWLREELGSHGWSSTRPDIEDWGWYMDVSKAGAVYLVGATGEAQAEADASSVVDWCLQLHRKRSLKERVLGRGKLAKQDELFELLRSVIQGEAQFLEVSVELNAD